MQVKHLDHLNLSVRNLDETADWYGRVFGFELVERGLYQGEPWGVLRSGEAMLCIYEHGGREAPAGSTEQRHGVNHFALRITDREAWERTVERESLEIGYGGEVAWPHSAAWYVYDPTGYEIEVVLWDEETIRFPAG